MSVEVRQMVVKSNVLQRCGQDESGAGSDKVSEESKNEILEECKRLVVEMLRERRER